jgi:hypothetical protein
MTSPEAHLLFQEIERINQEIQRINILVKHHRLEKLIRPVRETDMTAITKAVSGGNRTDPVASSNGGGEGPGLNGEAAAV